MIRSAVPKRVPARLPTRVSIRDRIRSGSALLSTALALVACGKSSTPELAVTTVTAEGPRVVAFDPPQGATDVDPARTTLAVTFDRAMEPEGWAWVVDNPATAPDIGESSWDPSFRINSVAVKLEPGRSYVVWVNSAEHAYFRDRSGTSVVPTRWSFTTRGAPSSAPGGAPAPVAPLAGHASSPPAVVKLDPPNGATDVDPARTLLRATFDRAMEGSWAWVTEGRDNFPEMAGQGYFEPDGRTATLPVKLEPGRSYALWLNSEEHQLFRDLAGTPARPLRWTFTTRAKSPG